MSEALTLNHTITHLNIAGNQITEEGELYLLDMLRSNITLTNLLYSSPKGTFASLKSSPSVRGFINTFNLIEEEDMKAVDRDINSFLKENDERRTFKESMVLDKQMIGHDLLLLNRKQSPFQTIDLSQYNLISTLASLILSVELNADSERRPLGQSSLSPNSLLDFSQRSSSFFLSSHSYQHFSFDKLLLFNNQITRIPIEELHTGDERWESLTSIDLSQNELTSLPPSIGSLAKLRFLDLRFNKINVIPPEISKLTVRIFLSLKGHRLVLINLIVKPFCC